MPSLRSSPRSPWRRSLVSVAAGSLVLAVAGCGSSSGADSAADGGGDLTAAQQECLDAANAYMDERGLLPETLSEELTPLSKPPTEGLTITKVYPGAVPSTAAIAQRLVEIAPTVGWTGKKLAFDGSVEDLNRKLLIAIEDSDVVEVDGFPPAAVQEPIRVAKERGVLLMLGAVTEEPESVPGFGGVPNGGELWNKNGELAGYAFLQATQCQANVAIFALPIQAMQNVSTNMQEVVERECEDCKISSTDIALTDIGSPAATNAVVSKLQSDPTIDFAFFTLGDLAVGMGPALKQAGLVVQVGGALPSPSNLAELEKGENSFWLGAADEITAWSKLDTA